VDRLDNQTGFCGAGKNLKVARAALHFWEEPCISGEKGSGTVFFSYCSLGCVYCQNRNISASADGLEITILRLAEIFLELQDKSAHNINLVTPDHYLPHILDALDIAEKSGLKIPVVYNCSGYQTVESLQMLNGYVDIYLPDFKYWDDLYAIKYSNAKGYSGTAKKAIAEMVRQTGEPAFDDNGIIKRGVIVRHLALPGLTEDSKKIIKYLYDTYSDRIYQSIMSQYTPMGLDKFPEIAQKITKAEYDGLVDYAVSLGVENAFIQEGEAAEESFIPPFNYEGVLNHELN
jgi:putative pyruvate formate lyase activating enzyme